MTDSTNPYADYSWVLTIDPVSGGCTGEIIEFPGCIAEGRNGAETARNLRIAADAWVAATLAQGQPVPEPRNRRW